MKQTENIKTLLNEIDWLEQVINQTIKSYFMQEGHEIHWLDLVAPDLSNNESVYANCVKHKDLNIYDRLALVLAMTPHLKPEVLDVFFAKNQIYDRGFTEFGGLVENNHSGFIPTGQTLSFLITSRNPEFRSNLINIFNKDRFLIKEQILLLAETEFPIPNLNGALSLSNRWMHYFLTEEKLEIEPSISFPARQITTNMNWEDIVLNETVLDQVQEINTWLNHRSTIMELWGLKKFIKPGYKALFYGPPGTGKTLTATLLGKASNKDVYKVDLSMIFSKYSGETVKNLTRFFDMAEHKDWILYFDEADALLEKRTAANSSKNRHPNQETSYLLQRIEDFPGTIILASNLMANIDESVSRRFQNMIHFTIPGPEDRLKIWKNAFSDRCTFSADIDLSKLAEEYELTGSSIINVLRFCALAAISREDTVVTKQELMMGLRKEFKKDNKTISVF